MSEKQEWISIQKLKSHFKAQKVKKIENLVKNKIILRFKAIISSEKDF